ncbi:MAG TPA: ATP-binding protein [Azospirillaceae bacterium]|nr:ATP-binding protein [Azospirillaceae bacterium]
MKARSAVAAPTPGDLPGLLAALPDPVIRFDLTGRCLWAHLPPPFPAPAQDPVGLPLREILGGGAADLVDGAKSVCAGIMAPVPNIQVGDDQNARFYEVRLTATSAAAGDVFAVLRDVTSQTLSELRLTSTVEAISEPFAIWDADDRLLICNSAYRRFLPHTYDLVQPGILFSDLLVKAIERGAFKLDGTSVDAFIADQTARRSASLPREVALADGRWILTRTVQLPHGGRANLSADVTTLKEREFALSAARKQQEELASALSDAASSLELARREAVAARLDAEAASRAKSDLLARVSHELRTPLNAVIGFAEILSGEVFGPLGDPRYVEYSHDIQASGRHLLSLINDIIDLSRLESGSYRLEISAVDLADPITAVVRLIQQNALRKGVDVVAETAGAPWANVDERAVRQILINLVGNAVKFTPSGGRVVVSTATDSSGDILLMVRDTGVGIPENEVAGLFTPFTRASNSDLSSDGGTGLGLAIVRSLTDLHGGEVSLTSRLGEGTTVTVRLPASRVITPNKPLMPWNIVDG